MAIPSFDTIHDIPLPTDAELVPHLTRMLERAFRHQIWVMLLDSESKPLPIVMPSHLDPEPDSDDIEGYADLFRCHSYDFQAATLVVTFERPGAARITENDRRWLRFLREALVETGCPFRGPYLLLGSRVRAVAPAEYSAAPFLEVDRDDDDEEYGFY